MFDSFKNRRRFLSTGAKLSWLKRKVGREEESAISLSGDEQREYIRHLIGWTMADIMDNKIQEWVYLQNYVKPEKMGKTEAEQRMGIVQQRIKNLEINLDAYRQYAVYHNIDLD